MKTLFAIGLASVSCFSAQAQANYANTNTKAITVNLPINLTVGNQLITGPTWGMYQSQGWLQVGYVQPPSNGWGVLGNYTITPSSNGYCSLLITGQYNLQIAADAALTNQPTWTGTFITNCQTFRANLRAAGTTETQAVVTVDTMNRYISQLAATNTTAVVTNLGNYIFMANQAAQILLNGQCDTTAHFPWRLIP